MGFAQSIDGVAVQIGDGFSVQFVCGSGVELHVAGQRGHICLGLRQGFAHIERCKLRQLLGVFEHQRTDFGQHAAPLNGSSAAPRACQCGLCCSHSRVDVIGVARRDTAQGAAIRRVDQGQGGTA